MDERILTPPPAPGIVLVRPSAAREDEPSEVREEEPPEIPEKKRSLGIAVHRALEERAGGRSFSPGGFLDWLMGPAHPDRGWVEKELLGDLARLEKSDFFARVRGAKITTEVPLLRRDSIPGEGERLIRGAVDLLAVYPGRIEFYDYKTARLTRERVERETARYLPQMELYSEVLGEIFGLPVTGYLVFTALGKIVRAV
ncbi:MAG: PD-(D/E)XK nuclease family protein [Candidatus Aureabacteria bacterium]|nr:PD-(D/E)XK nuclease family protein [Candidatus Auribacterota bacterium]